MANRGQIIQAEGALALASARKLLQEYWNSFGFTPCFQSFGEELAGLPGPYAPPEGRLALAMMDDKPAGCIALRRLDALRAEAKRLYVRPEFRGHGLGRALMEWVIGEGRGAGYREIVGDTMPEMRVARVLYKHMGFEQGEPYSAQPTQGAIFIRIAL